MWKKGMWASAIDNGVHVPVFYTPVFYLGTDWVKGVEWEESLGEFFVYGMFCFVFLVLGLF